MIRRAAIATLVATLATTAHAETSMQAINPPFVDIPGVSQAVLAPKGRTLFISGQVPMGPNGLAGEDLASQADQAFANFEATLAAAGATWDDVARLTFYVKGYDPTQLDTMRALRDKWVTSSVPPASALIGVADLFHPQALIEIDGVAVISD